MKLKFKKGDVVIVTDYKYQYNLYKDWFKDAHHPKLKKGWNYDWDVMEEEEYKVEVCEHHPTLANEIICLIKNNNGEKYLIEQKGLKKKM